MSKRRLVYRRLDDLVPDENNPKYHADEELTASMERFGFTEPPLEDGRTGKVSAGHGRLERLRAARDAGAKRPAGIKRARDGEWLIPVIEGWASVDDDDARAYLVASNRIPEVGGWEPEPLAAGLDGIDLTGVGFDAFDVEELRGALGTVEAVLPIDTSSFVGQQVQSVILNYPTERYDEVVETARRARAALGVDDNASLFRVLLEQACGS